MISRSVENGYVAVSLSDLTGCTRSMRIPVEALVDFLEVRPSESLTLQDCFCFVQDHAEYFEKICEVISVERPDVAFEISSTDIRDFERKYSFVFNRFPSAKIGKRFGMNAGY